MKTLELNQMEVIEGGGFLDGACKVLEISAVGAGVAAYVGVLAITGWGLGVLAIGGAACLAWDLWG